MSLNEQKKIIDNENESDSVGNSSQFNDMCLKYMSDMGYGDICSQFSKDLNISFDSSLILERRTKIREMVERGEIDGVITEINDINVEVIDKNYYLYYILIQHKAYEKANKIHLMKNIDENTRIGMILQVIEYIKNELSDLLLKHSHLVPEVEDLLEYLIFNSSNISIGEKRSQLADTINRIILDKYSSEVNEMEMIIRGILSEESTLSKTNKFTEFKDIILNKKC